MRTNERSYLHWSLGILAAVSLGLALAPAWALGPGAPPVIRVATVDVFTVGTSSPSLNVNLEIEIPGGNVPINVQSVTVTIPDARMFTLPLERTDLRPEGTYSRSFTAAEITGFPVGTYTFTVTDTAGGVATATDSLGPTTGLAAPASISITGLVAVPATNGVVNLLNLAATPTPTVSWAPVVGAANYRIKIRGGFNDLNLFTRYTGSGVNTSITLPAGVLVPGRRYQVRVYAYDHVNGDDCIPQPCTYEDSNAQSRNQIEIVTQGPEIFLTFNNGNYTAGQTLDVTARIYNTGPAVKVNANAWIGLPTGAVVPILNLPNLTILNSTGNPTGPNDFYTGSIGFSYMFTGSEPSGNYVVGLRLTDPDTNGTVALATRTFAK